VTQPPVSTSQGGRGNWFWLFALILVVVIAVAVGITVLVQNWPESRRYGRRTVNPPVTRPLAPDKHVQEPGNDAWLQQVRKIINEKLQEQQQKTMDAVHHHAERSSARVSQEIRHDLADYVSEGELESKLKAMESGLNQSVGQINSALNSDIRGLADRIASIEADLNALRQEKLAKRNAIIMEACKKVDGLISQLAAAIAPATARLLNGLTMASRAEALPQVVKAGQRLTAEFYAIPGGESLRAYMVAIGRLQEVRDKLERLLLSTVSDLTPDSLLREAETVFESYVNAHNHERLSPGLVEQTRQALVNEIGMPYISLVMGRLQGDSVAASQQIARIMQELGYDLIEIVVGKTRPDARYHEVGSAAPTDRHPAGTITSVVRMGYIERTTGEISRAQVIVAA
jgi:molecular chaperone GrpE (heat shock protein)